MSLNILWYQKLMQISVNSDIAKCLTRHEPDLCVQHYRKYQSLSLSPFAIFHLLNRIFMCVNCNSGGGLAQLVASLIASTKLINARPG